VPGPKRLIRFAAAQPGFVLVSLALLTALAAGQLTRLEVNISAEGMLEKGRPAWDQLCQAEGARQTCWR
jgi:predicted RND superfamily exporter protein